MRCLDWASEFEVSSSLNHFFRCMGLAPRAWCKVHAQRCNCTTLQILSIAAGRLSGKLVFVLRVERYLNGLMGKSDRVMG
jgi:hypothetical protein